MGGEDKKAGEQDRIKDFLGPNHDGSDTLIVDQEALGLHDGKMRRMSLQRGISMDDFIPLESPEHECWFRETIKSITEALKQGKNVLLTDEVFDLLYDMGKAKGVDNFINLLVGALGTVVLFNKCPEKEGGWIITIPPKELVEEMIRKIRENILDPINAKIKE